MNDPDVGDARGDDGVGAGIDRWARQHPWHPRIGPWFAYLLLLSLLLQVRQWESWTYGPLKLFQAAAVGYLIWRWRFLVSELSLRFHWSVIPVSLALTATWIALGDWMLAAWPDQAAGEPSFWQSLHGENRSRFWLAATAHLVAMCTVVPLIEETFNRSLLLRSFHDPRATGTAVLQILADLPLIGDWISNTAAGKRAIQQGPVLGVQFQQTPLGALSGFGVLVSTCVFASVHQPRDWPAAVICGVTWCLLLNRTRHLGLGPVIWSHALVNLLLWGHVVAREAWHFL